MNPNMRNEKLRGVFEELGFENVRTVISSGNVLFESKSTAVKAMESKIEAAFPEKLGFNSTTIIRSKRQLQTLVEQDPFKGAEHTRKTYLTVTFAKNKLRMKLKVPHTPDARDYRIVALYDREICSVMDLDSATAPNLMPWVDREFGKEITTRTYQTVFRILKKFEG